MQIEVNRIIKSTRAEGFGKRYCIWTQGCSIRCKGCFNQHMWEKGQGTKMDINELVSDILSCSDIEGVTFLGGEPFDQAEAVFEIARSVRKYGLSIITFTGYEYEYLLNSKNKNFKDLIQISDILIDGRFDIEMYSHARPWVGSSNQRYIFLTDRYKYSELQCVKNCFEITIKKNGEIFVNGMGNYLELISCLKEGRPIL